MTFAPMHEDPVQTLSQLVFASMSPGQPTLKLYDPATGALDDYLLVKASSIYAPGPRPANSSHVSFPGGSPFKTSLPSRKHRVSTSGYRSILGTGLPRSAALPPVIQDSSDSNMSRASPYARFGQTSRTAFGRDRAGRDTFSPTPLLPQGPWEKDTPSLLNDTHASDADTSNSSMDRLPTKYRLFSSRISRHASQPADDSSSQSVGLGFSMAKDDGTLFDGLGTLPPHSYAIDVASPTDEARARAHERRVLRGAPSLDSPVVGPPKAVRSLKEVRFSAVTHHVSEEEFGTRSVVATPISLGSRVPATPSAPVRRVVGRLPVDFGREKERRARRNSMLEASRASPERGSAFGVQRRSSLVTHAKSSRLEGRVLGSKRTSAVEGLGMGDQLRFWSTWMTPMMTERDGKARTTWKP